MLPNLSRYFIVLFVLGIGGRLSGEKPYDKPLPNAADTLSANIQRLVKELEYPDSVGKDLSKLALKWGCDVLFRVLQEESELYELNTNELASVERLCLYDIYKTLGNEFTFREVYELDKMIAVKHANCFGDTQLYYILYNSIGIKSKLIEVQEASFTLESSHVVCLSYLSDGKVLFVDQGSYFSSPFVFDDVYKSIDLCLANEPSQRGSLA